ncbi:MAG: efflux transporter outer membrane subunit [Verrucomicrobiaceae bacterium]|nr:efflux transporter outer membrane subunit [Verrucomicrobiaceae bacterium]
MTRTGNCLISVIVSAGLTSCGSLANNNKEDLKAQSAKAPEKWTAVLPNVSKESPTAWLSAFAHPELTALVDKALQGNPDLRLAAARVREAQALARVAGAQRLPQADIDFSSMRSQRPSGTRFAGLGSRANRFESMLDITWEADVWGRIKAQRQSAVAEVEARQEDEQAARLSLSASVVTAATNLTEATLQAALAEDNVNALRTQLGVLSKQLERGLNAERGALDITLSRSDLARAEATVQTRRREIDAAKRNLESLLGDYPAGKVKGLTFLPSMTSSIRAGLPSELLLRRPDIRAAERRLAAAVSDEKVARTAFLPSIRLTTGAGLSSAELSSLLQRESLLWSIAGSVAQALFQGGRLQANVDAALARYDQALERYAQTALRAFTEVETTLAAEHFWAEQENSLRAASTEAAQAENLARTSYERGLSDILTLLDSRRRAYDASSALISAQASRLRNRVSTYLALGGAAR